MALRWCATGMIQASKQFRRERVGLFGISSPGSRE
jgi:hypothetical protein